MPGPAEHAVELGDGRARRRGSGASIESGEAIGRVRGVLGEPVVVRAHEREMEVGVLGGDDALREARGGVEDLGVDAVAIHLREPGGGVVAAGADIFEA